MSMQPQGPAAPQISMLEAAQAATDEAADQFCWSVAQVLKRILDPAPLAAGDEDVDKETQGG